MKTKRDPIQKRLDALKFFSNKIVLLSIMEAIVRGIITEEQLEANHGSIKEGLLEGYYSGDELLAVWYSREEETYKWEI